VRRVRNTVYVDAAHNLAQKPGVFSIDAAPDDNGILGDSTYIQNWFGMADINGILDVLPPPTILTTIWFDDSVTYKWS